MQAASAWGKPFPRLGHHEELWHLDDPQCLMEAAQSIARIWRIVREWKAHFEESQVPADQIENVAPAFRHIDDVSTPALRKLIP